MAEAVPTAVHAKFLQSVTLAHSNRHATETGLSHLADSSHILWSSQPEGPSLAGRTVRVIHNPTAGLGRRRRLARAVTVLEAAGLTVQVTDTTGPDDATRLAEAAPPGTAAVIAAGGDGTINEVVNGLMRRPAPGEGETAPALGILPLGTANVLAHELGLPVDPGAAAAVIAAGRRRAVVPARCNGRFYMMMCGAGFDGRVVRAVGPRLKRMLGKGAYAWQMARQLWMGGLEKLAVAIDGGPPVAAASVVVSRGRFYGGRYVVAPGADLGERLSTVAYMVWLGIGRLARRHDYAVLPATSVEIVGAAGEPVQADGEICGTVPISIGLADRPLDILVP
jgi:YegS/Rv2252/BmrU family lipid kinase